MIVKSCTYYGECITTVESCLYEMGMRIVRSCAIEAAERSASLSGFFGSPVLGHADDFLAWLERSEPDRGSSKRILVPQESFEVEPISGAIERRTEMVVLRDDDALFELFRSPRGERDALRGKSCCGDLAARLLRDAVVRSMIDVQVRYSVSCLLAMRVWRCGRLSQRELCEALVQLLWVAFLHERQGGSHAKWENNCATESRRKQISSDRVFKKCDLAISEVCGRAGKETDDCEKKSHATLQVERAARANRLAYLDFSERTQLLCLACSGKTAADHLRSGRFCTEVSESGAEAGRVPHRQA